MIEFLCPICNIEIDCKGNLSAFNRHIDKCIMKEEDTNKSGHQIDAIVEQKEK